MSRDAKQTSSGAITPPPVEDAADGRGQQDEAARTFFDRPAPADYLAEWSRRLAQPEPVVETDSLSVFLFRLRAEWLALATEHLVEITDPRPVHSIPHRTGAVLLGLVNIRGQLRLCVSLHGLLEAEPTAGRGGAEPKRAEAPRLVVVQDALEEWVFPAEEVAGVHRLARTRLRPLPATFPKGASLVQAVFDWHEHTVGYLDAARVFSSLRSQCQ